MDMKDDFFKLENEEWTKVEFKDIKNFSITENSKGEIKEF